MENNAQDKVFTNTDLLKNIQQQLSEEYLLDKLKDIRTRGRQNDAVREHIIDPFVKSPKFISNVMAAMALGNMGQLGEWDEADKWKKHVYFRPGSDVEEAYIRRDDISKDLDRQARDIHDRLEDLADQIHKSKIALVNKNFNNVFNQSNLYRYEEVLEEDPWFYDEGVVDMVHNVDLNVDSLINGFQQNLTINSISPEFPINLQNQQ